MDNSTQNNDNNSDSTVAITDVSKLLADVSNDDNNDANNIANMIAESANKVLTSDNSDANMIAESANNVLTSDNKDANTLLTPDNTDNTVITLDNTVLQQVDNTDNILLTLDNKDNNTDNTSANNDNTDVSTLGKSYNIRLEGVFVQKVNQLSDLTGIAATAYVTSLVKAQLSETTPTIDLDKIRADERQKCAAQHAEMMKLYMPIATHQKEVNQINETLNLQLEKYDLLHKEAKRLFKELATANQTINDKPIPKYANLAADTEVINLNDFQQIFYKITETIARNRFANTTDLYNLSINLFNQTIAQKQ